MIIYSLILTIIYLILSIYVIYKNLTKITELENRIYLYEGVINELKNEITELKERK